MNEDWQVLFYFNSNVLLCFYSFPHVVKHDMGVFF